MIRREYDTLLKKIQSIYPTFSVDEEEWWNIFNKYSYKEVCENLENYDEDRPPLYMNLVKGLKEEVKRKPAYIQCDICKEKILVADDWDVFEEHHRRCSKIDFIDRECKRIKGEGIDYSFYKFMSEDDLNQRYRKIMDNWKKGHKDICLGNLFQKI